MSKTVDSRVVEMRFDNKQFESNVQTSMSTLDKLKQKLRLEDSSKGLENVNKAAKNVNMSGLSGAIDTVQAKFSALGVIGVTALANITNSAINAGKRIAAALTIDPIETGFQEYETQINAVQTILANTSAKGTTLQQVNDALDELNTYADKTIYNFTEMTRNIGTFTAAGVDLETSVSAIQGIANLAAVSGSTSQQASTAMYQLSQALAAGKVQLMDWNSVVNAGMGGEVFQNALKRTATQMGKNVDAMIEKYGSFRESLTQGEWLTTDVLTETLKQLSGAYTEADLIAQGYTESQAKEITQLATTAVDAATKVKTFTQLWDTLKEAAQSGWTQSWEIIVGDFEEAKETLSNVSDVFGNIIAESANARNQVLQGWKDLGGRTALLDSFKNTFEGIRSIVSPLKQSFTEIFPPITAQQLMAFTEGLRNLTSHFKITNQTADKLKRTFKGVFSVFGIVKQGVTALGKGFFDLIGKAVPLGGNILDITANIGDFISGINDAIKSSGVFECVVSSISKAAGLAVKGISAITKGFSSLTSGNLFKSIGTMLSGIADKIGEAMRIIKEKVSNGIKNLGFDGAFDMLNAGLFTALIVGIKKVIDKLSSIAESGAGLLTPIKELLDGVKGALEAWQTSLKSDVLMKIAVAVGILAASLVALSTIDHAGLATALTAMTVSFGELIGSLTLLNKVASGKNFKGTTALIGLATAVLILSKALVNISQLDWGQLAVGVTGMTVALGELIGASALLSKSGAGAGTALTLIGIATAMVILSKALTSMGSMSWSEIGKGLATLGGSLLILCAALALMQSSIGGAMSLLIVAGALNALAPVLQQFGSMSLSEIGKSLLELGASLGILCAALALMQSSIGGAIALTIVSAGITLLAGALSTLAGLSIGQIISSLIGLAAALAVIGVASVVFSSLIGPMLIFAGGLAAVSVAIMVFGAAMGVLGNGLDSLVASMQALSGIGDISSVSAGIAELAGALTLLGAAGIVSLIGDLGLLGLAAALVAVKSAASDLSSNLDSAANSIQSLTNAMDGISIADAGAKFIESFVSSIRNKISDVDGAIKDIEKKVTDAFSNLNTSSIKEVGRKVVEALADGIKAEKSSIETAINDLLSSVASSANFDSSSFSDAGIKAGQAFSEGLQSAVSTISTSVMVVAKTAASAASASTGVYLSAGANLGQALSTGVGSQSGAASNAGSMLGQAGAMGANSQSGTYSSTGTNLGNALSGGIQANSGSASSAGSALGQAGASGARGSYSGFLSAGSYIASGLAAGIRGAISSVVSAAVSLAQSALSAAKSALGIQSPSRAFMTVGRYIGEGLANGIRDSAYLSVRETEGAAERLKDVANSAFEDVESWVEDAKYFNELSLAEELELWELMISKYAEGTEERLKAEKNAYKVYQELQEADYQNSVDWIEREKQYNRLSLEEELAAWERVQARYIKGTEERETADEKVYNLKHQLIDESIEKLDQEIAKQKELLSVMQEGSVDYANTLKEITYLESKRLDAQEQHSLDWIQKQDDYDLWNGLTDKLAAYTRVQQRYVKGTAKRLEYDKKVYNIQKEIYDAYQQYKDDVAKAEAERDEKLLDLRQEYLDKETEINDKLKQDIQELDDAYQDSLESRAKSLYDSYGLFDEVSKKDEVSASTLMKNLQDQVAEFEDWDKTLDQLSARGLNDALIEELQEMGPSAVAEIKALNSMSDSQLAQYATLWQTKHNEARERAVDELEDMRVDTQNQIAALKVQAKVDLDEYTEIWNEKVREIRTSSDAQLDELRNDFHKNVGIIKTDTEKEFSEMVTTVQSIMLDAGWSEIGENIVNGLTQGVKNAADTFIDVLSGVVISGEGEVKYVTKEHSPSKVYAEIGRYMIEGLVVGIQSVGDTVPKACSEVGYSAIDAMGDAISGIASVIGGGIDINPTIRPVIDLTDVRKGFGQIDGAFNANRSIRLGMDIAYSNQNGNRLDIDSIASKIADANTRSDSKITGAIEALKSDLAGLVDKVSGLQVVMDTGSLVGAITPEMDRSLGNVARMNRRGVK